MSIMLSVSVSITRALSAETDVVVSLYRLEDEVLAGSRTVAVQDVGTMTVEFDIDLSALDAAKGVAEPSFYATVSQEGFELARALECAPLSPRVRSNREPVDVRLRELSVSTGGAVPADDPWKVATDGIRKFDAHGLVTDIDGSPCGAAQVVVYELRLGAEVEVGAGVTGSDGRFSAELSMSAESRPTLRAVARDDNGADIGESEPVPCATRPARLDIRGDKALADLSLKDVEFERVAACLSELLPSIDEQASPQARAQLADSLFDDIAGFQASACACCSPALVASYVRSLAARLSYLGHGDFALFPPGSTVPNPLLPELGSPTHQGLYAIDRSGTAVYPRAELATVQFDSMASALDRAVDERVVSAVAEDRKDALALVRLAAMLVASDASATTTRLLSSISSSTLASSAEARAAVLETHAMAGATMLAESSFEGVAYDYWFDELLAPRLGGTLSKQVRALLGFHRIAGHHAATTLAAVDLKAGDPPVPSQVAEEWELSAFVTLVDHVGRPNFPSWLADPETDESRDAYAAWLLARFRSLAALGHFSAPQGTSDPNARALMEDFFASVGASEFSPLHRSVADAVAPGADARPSSWDSATGADVDAATEALKAQQRIAKLTTNDTLAEWLLANNFDSAFAISAESRGGFVGKVESAQLGLAEGEAELVHHRAERRAQRAALYLHNLRDLKLARDGAPGRGSLEKPPTPLAGLGLRVAAPAGDTLGEALAAQAPTLSALLGKISYSECRHCESTFGPGAYLVDLIAFLKRNVAMDGQTTLAEIVLGGGSVAGRRPDLLSLELSCENTDTRVPYLQIVNQVLVDNVINELGGAVTEEAVWSHLASAHQPWALPYSDGAAEFESLHSVYQSSRTSLLAAVHDPDDWSATPLAPSVGDAILATELGLTAGALEAVSSNGGTPMVELHDRWGLDVADLSTLLDPAELFNKADLQVEDFQRLARNPVARSIGLRLSPSEDGDPSDLTLHTIETNAGTPAESAASVAELHTQLLLSRSDRLREFESALLVFAVGGGSFVATLDDAARSEMAEILRVASDFDFSVSEACALVTDPASAPASGDYERELHTWRITFPSGAGAAQMEFSIGGEDYPHSGSTVAELVGRITGELPSDPPVPLAPVVCSMPQDNVVILRAKRPGDTIEITAATHVSADVVVGRSWPPQCLAEELWDRRSALVPSQAGWQLSSDGSEPPSWGPGVAVGSADAERRWLSAALSVPAADIGQLYDESDWLAPGSGATFLSVARMGLVLRALGLSAAEWQSLTWLHGAVDLSGPRPARMLAQWMRRAGRTLTVGPPSELRGALDALPGAGELGSARVTSVSIDAFRASLRDQISGSETRGRVDSRSAASALARLEDTAAELAGVVDDPTEREGLHVALSVVLDAVGLGCSEEFRDAGLKLIVAPGASAVPGDTLKLTGKVDGSPVTLMNEEVGDVLPDEAVVAAFIANESNATFTWADQGGGTILGAGTGTRVTDLLLSHTKTDGSAGGISVSVLATAGWRVTVAPSAGGGVRARLTLDGTLVDFGPDPDALSASEIADIIEAAYGGATNRTTDGESIHIDLFAEGREPDVVLAGSRAGTSSLAIDYPSLRNDFDSKLQSSADGVASSIARLAGVANVTDAQMRASLIAERGQIALPNIAISTDAAARACVLLVAAEQATTSRAAAVGALQEWTGTTPTVAAWMVDNIRDSGGRSLGDSLCSALELLDLSPDDPSVAELLSRAWRSTALLKLADLSAATWTSEALTQVFDASLSTTLGGGDATTREMVQSVLAVAALASLLRPFDDDEKLRAVSMLTAAQDHEDIAFVETLSQMTDAPAGELSAALQIAAATDKLQACLFVGAIVREHRVRRLPLSASFAPADPAVAHGIGSLRPTRADADVLSQNLAVRFGSSWNERRERLLESRREARRDALVAYLRNKRGLPNARRLYHELLLDVQMSGCHSISRVLEATSAIQLYVQRCFLQLERYWNGSDQLIEQLSVQLDSSAADEWNVLGRYRVWEANKRVFVYPENWLDPAWRTDKSHAFENLEAAIRQPDLDATGADEAFLGFLEDVAEVGSLEICAVHTAGSGRRTRTHVVARTWTAPYNYYYRERSGIGIWSAWEPLPDSLNAPHVTVVERAGIEAGQFEVLVLQAKLELTQHQILENGTETPGRVLGELSYVSRRGGRWGDARTLVDLRIDAHPENDTSELNQDDFALSVGAVPGSASWLLVGIRQRAVRQSGAVMRQAWPRYVNLSSGRAARTIRKDDGGRLGLGLGFLADAPTRASGLNVSQQRLASGARGLELSLVDPEHSDFPRGPEPVFVAGSELAVAGDVKYGAIRLQVDRPFGFLDGHRGHSYVVSPATHTRVQVRDPLAEYYLDVKVDWLVDDKWSPPVVEGGLNDPDVRSVRPSELSVPMGATAGTAPASGPLNLQTSLETAESYALEFPATGGVHPGGRDGGLA